MKLELNYNSLFDFVRNFQLTLIKLKRIDSFYKILFDFAHEEAEKLIEDLNTESAEDKRRKIKNTLCYINRVYLSLYHNFTIVSNGNSQKNAIQQIPLELNRLESLLKQLNSKYDKKYEDNPFVFKRSLELSNLILKYSHQIQKITT
jgi:archaellum component FlaC